MVCYTGGSNDLSQLWQPLFRGSHIGRLWQMCEDCQIAVPWGSGRIEASPRLEQLTNKKSMYERVYSNGIIEAERFETKEDYDANERMIEECRERFGRLNGCLNGLGLKNMAGFGEFGPQWQRVLIRFTRLEDCFNGIWQNGMYLKFKVDFEAGTFEVCDYGHIYLTKSDSERSYLCMCGLKNAWKATGRPWPRKSKFKTEEDMAERISKICKTAVEVLDETTEGYPYKQMKINIY